MAMLLLHYTHMHRSPTDSQGHANETAFPPFIPLQMKIDSLPPRVEHATRNRSSGASSLDGVCNQSNQSRFNCDQGEPATSRQADGLMGKDEKTNAGDD
jgi:hypothetical protein